MPRHNSFDELGYFGFIGDVDAVSFEPRAAPASRSLQRLELVCRPIRNDHTVAFLEERQAHRASQSSRASRYQHHSSRSHCFLRLPTQFRRPFRATQRGVISILGAATP